jgi:DNA (cytosine-5)-methyltransferase 1
MKVLNLYSGLGGNRKLWTDVEVTAVENNPHIAKFYKNQFPKDRVCITDAHKFLLEHFEEFDFIWSSPPCPTHSDARRAQVQGNKMKAVYPNMQLYEEIILLQNFYKGLFVVENVISYYRPLIKPQICGRHYLWANFPIPNTSFTKKHIYNSIAPMERLTGFDLSHYTKIQKRKALRNCVLPDLGKYILDCSQKQKTLDDAL